MPFKPTISFDHGEDEESLSGQTVVALAPRGPVAGTVDVVKT